MRRLSVTLVATVSIVAFTQIAAAADLARKAPVYTPPPPPPSWTGFYVGVNGGYHLGRYDTSMTNTDPDPGAASGITSPQGAVLGVQAGYNWQTSPVWLVGVEGDWQWTSNRNTNTICLGECGTAGAGGDDQLQIKTELDWIATFRARTGWIHNDYLWYVTGGAAIGQAKISATGFDLDTTTAPVGTISNSSSRGGYAVGGGVETMLGGPLTAKLEYLFVGLGTISTTGHVAINGSPTEISSASSRIGEHIIRLGLNWKFQ